MEARKRGLYILVVLIITAMVVSCSPSGPSDEQIKQDIKAFVDHLNGNKFIGAGKIKFMGSEILGKSVEGTNCGVTFKRTVTYLDTNKTETDTYSSFYKKYDTGWRCEIGHCPPKS
jgi:hypothetical protein